MKHVLIHWTATNETSILTDAFVRDKSMLQDPKKEGMVFFGKQGTKPPKSGWKAYLGRVIAVSDRREIVYGKEREFLSSQRQSFTETKGDDSDITDTDSDIKRITKTRSKDLKSKSGKRKTVESDDSDSDNRTNEKLVSALPPKRAKKHAEMEAYKKMVENMELPTSSLPSDSYDDIFEVESESVVDINNKDDKLFFALKDLQKEVAQLRKENMELQKRLPKLVAEAVSQKLIPKKNSEMERKRLVYASSPQTTSTPVNKNTSGFSSTETKPNNSQRKERNSGESDELVSSEASSPSSVSNPQLSDILSQSQLNEIQRSPSDKKMTASLLLAVFGKKHLSESSVTGRKQGAMECRPALDSVKVKLIIDHVLKHFPKLATEFTIKATMAQKCKDERRLMEARRIKAEEK